MSSFIRIAIGQLDMTVGDFAGNVIKLADYTQRAKGLGADIVVFPELALTGYPPEDLLHKASFIDDNIDALKAYAVATSDIIAVVGFVDRHANLLYNSAAVIYNNTIKGVYHKMMLPNYGVFDENRYFEKGIDPLVFHVSLYPYKQRSNAETSEKAYDLVFAVNICEDIWHHSGPTRKQAIEGAQLIINISASPYHYGKTAERDEILRSQARENRVKIVYANMVGGQDELVFDGQSMVIDERGKVVLRAGAFVEGIYAVDIDVPQDSAGPGIKAIPVTDRLTAKIRPPISLPGSVRQDQTAEIYEALVVGTRDYVLKNRFSKTVIGLSGGVDSALVAAIACDALGKDSVTGVYMPSRYSSIESETDARELASNLGIRLMTVSIEEMFKVYLKSLEPVFDGSHKDITEENLQARIRGNILMALSNKFGWLVLTTGNKSEMSTGYATLYGDMAGGLAVIKDVPKTLVYRLAHHRNKAGKIIPDNVLTKAPTAELKPDQKDSDSLPAYDILDPILKAYVEEDKDLDDIMKLGYDKDTVIRVLSLVDKSEYKRRQSPPGIKITAKAFGRDRRMPITNLYR